MRVPAYRLRQLRAPFVTLALALAATACGDGPAPPQDQFPEEVYSLDFEATVFSTGQFVGQDQWFAAFGDDAVSVVSGDVRAPADGSRALRVDGSLMEESQGYYFGSYARPLPYSPLGSGTPRVVVEGWVALSEDEDGDDDPEEPSCGCSIGLSGDLNGEPVANLLIGIQPRDGGYVAYLSNYDSVAVYGPTYAAGEWLHVRAVLDFDTRTAEGFADGESFGQVPFTTGVSDEIAFVNVALGSSQPVPGVTGYFDGIRVAASR